MSTRRKRWLSLAIVVFFCLLCAGTSRPKGRGGSSGSGVKKAPIASSLPPAHLPHGTSVEGRIDPLDPKLDADGGHYDSYTLTLGAGRTYRVTVEPAKTDAGVDADAALPELWFSVRVSPGTPFAPGRALAVQERVQNGKTTATFRPTIAGAHTLVVTVYFGQDEAQTPGFSTYVLEVNPIP